MKTRNIFSTLMLLAVSVQLSAQVEWKNPMSGEEPYLCGRAWNAEIGQKWQRLPDRVEGSVTKAVWGLSKQTAGMAVRFTSTSRTIRVRYGLTNSSPSHRNMAPLDHSGVDLYGKTVDGETHWIGTHMSWKWTRDTVAMEWQRITPPSSKGRGIEYTLYLPPYNGLKWLEIGVDKGADFQFVRQSPERPIVCYGSSIIQGASPSRPGLMISNIVEREMEYPVINLGFSGSARLEPGVFDVLSEIDARAFVVDPIPNAFNLKPDTVTQRTLAGIRKLRAKSQAPILLVENHPLPDSVMRPDVNAKYARGNKALRRAYDQLLAEGVQGIYYLSHGEIAWGEDFMIEGTHPNDLGSRAYADAYEKKLREMLAEDKADPLFPPVTQRRDGCYEWRVRHNEVVERNHKANPEILMIGNSITHFWGGEPKASVCYGGKTWEKTFGKRSVTNMGFGWDKIENVYWRIFHGELEGCAPRHICLLIGINNLSSRTSEDIAHGVVALAALIRERQPQAKLHVLKIYPARGRETKVARTNSLIEQWLPTDEMTELVDIASSLMLQDGSGKTDLKYFNKDGLHPNEAGYEVIGKILKKHLK